MLLEDYHNLVNEITKINEDEEIPIQKPDETPVEHEESSDPADPRENVHNAIEAQVEVANSLISSIEDAFADNCNRSKKMMNMEDQVKNWEKQARGACQQIVSVVENKKFMPDKTNSSPRAYKKIRNSDSRDLSVIDLCAAIIVFYNSLS